MTTVGIIVACLGTVLILRHRRNRRIRALNCVTGPNVLMLDLSDGLDADLVQADRAIYGPEFSVVTVSTRPDVLETGRFDIVHVFARADSTGGIAGLTPQGFMTMLQAAEPRLVIMASSNPASAHPGAEILGGMKGRVNLIWTIDRRGERLGLFLMRLFRFMFEGRGFAFSWVKLSPQDDAPEHPDDPLTFCNLAHSGLFFAVAKRSGWRPAEPGAVAS